MRRTIAIACLLLIGAGLAAQALPASYARALANVLVHEGGYSNHPNDPGGVTLNGVIQRRYNQYRSDHGLPYRALTPAMLRDPSWPPERAAIYDRYYARPCAFAELPAGLDYTVFDYCVNSGIGRAPKVLQRILGVEPDGEIGAETMAAVRQRDVKQLIRAVNDERRAFVHRLRTCATFCVGWDRRILNVRTNSLAMADGRRAAVSLFDMRAAPGKALEEDEVMP